jgi:two-component system sensor histidine kinase PilS (NtrC family)
MADNAMSLRLKALIAFRAAFVTLLLGSSFLFRVEGFTVYPNAIFFFIVYLYSLTIAYSLFINRIENLFAFGYIQLTLDVLSGVALVYITGGIESWFSFTLIVTVLASSIILNKKAGYIIASLSSILYGVLLDLQFYRLLPLQRGGAEEKEYLYNIFIHILSFYVTAYLSGYLSSRLEKTVQTLEERDTHLKDLEFFNMKVIEGLPSGLFTTDMGGNTLIFNKAAEQITGMKKEEVIGGSISLALPFLGFPLKKGRFEGVLEKASQSTKIVGVNISVIEDISGNETGFIGMFQDLTILKRLEAEVKQKEKWAAIGELSANIAHEIRNPIASMKSAIEMLREDTIPAKHRGKLMEIALNEMERLDSTITDFLTYSSPKPLNMQRVDLHLLLDESLSLIDTTEHTKGDVLIKRDFEGELFIYADPQKMRQVFWNLEVNAVEAMERGGVLTVSTKVEPHIVRIFFTDTGPGIDPAKSEKIFYPFFTTKDKGTGLGLSIAYRIIEEHKGRLSVRSNPGTETTFEIILNIDGGPRS